VNYQNYENLMLLTSSDTQRTLMHPNRLSSTIGGNREINQLYTTSQVSNITRTMKCYQIS